MNHDKKEMEDNISRVKTLWEPSVDRAVVLESIALILINYEKFMMETYG